MRCGWGHTGSQIPVPHNVTVALTPNAQDSYDSAFPADHQPASPEILAMMYVGRTNPSVKGWLASIIPDSQKTFEKYGNAFVIADVLDTSVDALVEEMQQHGEDPNDGAQFVRRVGSRMQCELLAKSISQRRQVFATNFQPWRRRAQLRRRGGQEFYLELDKPMPKKARKLETKCREP